MAQHDYTIDNQTGANFRTDLNNALSAIQSSNSGATEPASTTAGQIWFETDTNLLKFRNSADNGWINIVNLSTGKFTNFTSTGIDDNASTTALTIDSSGNVGIGTGSPSKLLQIAGTDGVLRVTTNRSGATYGNSAILLDSPRSSSSDGTTVGGRGLLSCLGNSSSSTGIVWLQAASASLEPTETDTDLKANQCGIRLESDGSFEHWSNNSLRFAIDSSGNVRADKFTDLAGTGAPDFPNGLTFAGNTTGGSVTGVTLDDYEEGTFQAEYSSSGTLPTVSSYGFREGFYVKIGSIVNFSLRMRANISSAGTGNAYIAGLPFPASSDTGYTAAVSVGYTENWTTISPQFSQISAGSSYLSLYNGSGASKTVISTSNYKTGGASYNEIYIAGTYKTNS